MSCIFNIENSNKSHIPFQEHLLNDVMPYKLPLEYRFSQPFTAHRINSINISG